MNYFDKEVFVTGNIILIFPVLLIVVLLIVGAYWFVRADTESRRYNDCRQTAIERVNHEMLALCEELR